MTKDNNTMEEMLEQNQSLFNIPRRGQIVNGRVVQVLKDEVIVNIGYKSDGIIPREEISNLSDVNLEEIVKEGENIEVYVLKSDDGEGNVLLSKKRVDIRKDWEFIEKAFKNKETIEVRITEVV